MDARVIQPRLRSALAKQYEVEIELARLKANRHAVNGDYTPDEERIAIDTFLAQRVSVRTSPGRSLLGDAMAFDTPRAALDVADPFGMSLPARQFSGLDG